MSAPDAELACTLDPSPADDAPNGDTLTGEALADAITEEAAARLAAESLAAEEEMAAMAADEEANANMEAATLKLQSSPTVKLPSNSTRLAQRAETVAATVAARSDWLKFGESMKPPHLRVPTGVYDIVDKLIQPVRQDPADVIQPPPRHGTGPLEPKAQVEGTVVRSFIHRMDRNHDDLLEPFELSELSVNKCLGIKEEKIMSMFERVIEKRPPGKRHNVGISALEIFNEMKVDKRWMKTTDLSVMCQDGEHYHVATEQETLERWCNSVKMEFASDYPDLAKPASWSPPEIERFFASVLSAKNPQTGKLLQSEEKVQALLKTQSDQLSQLTIRPRIFALATVAAQRQAWGWEAQPYRDEWLRFFRAAGLKPLQALDGMSGKEAAKADAEDKIKIVIPANIARSPKKPGMSQVRVRDPKPKVAVREGQAEAEHLSRKIQLDAAPISPWDDKRAHTQSLVNSSMARVIGPRVIPVPSSPGDGGFQIRPEDAKAADAGVSVSFDARRRFLQMQAKQGRDSVQQQSIGKERQELVRQQSLLGQAGASVANLGVNLGGRHEHLGFSHHHLTNSLEPSHTRLSYEKDMGHAWDGSHLDHSKLAPVMDDVKLSRMNRDERDRQFGTYFEVPGNQAARVQGLEGVKDVNQPYASWQNPEFREDLPIRHGKYGRRVFDAHVREVPLQNNISGIDAKPMEEFFHQQDMVNEFLERSLPPGQQKHFEQCLPPANAPYRKEVDLTGRHLTGMRNYI